MPELHQRAEALVLCAIADDTYNNYELNQEVGLFLLGLIHEDKKRQLKAACRGELQLKTMQVAALNDHVSLEIER